MPESAPSTPHQTAPSQDVLRYFLETQIGNPDFMKNLANRLWLELPSAEREALASAIIPVGPEDLVGQQNSLKAQLLVKYVLDGIYGYQLLEDSLGPIEIIVKPEPTEGTDAV